MKINTKTLTTAITVALSALLLLTPVVNAGGTIEVDDLKWISVGAGLRTSFNSVEDAAPSGTDRSKDFVLDSIRLYINAQVHENIKFEFNTERFDDGIDDDIRVLDAVAKFSGSDIVNVWMGRFLPPSDRSNLSGPYFLNAWDFPFVQQYPADFAGRDDGIALWGQVNGGQFKYQVGAFEGLGDVAGGPNQDDNLLYAGRVVVNFWDPEPGYYNSSTYYGAKNILALGAVIMTQSDALGTAIAPGDFTGWNIDGLLERRIAGGGVVTVEAAYYDYDRDNVVGSPDSDGYFLLGSYLFPQKLGIGQLQPMVRYQELDTDTVGDTERWDIGLNYIIDGHNARISILYADVDAPGSLADVDIFRLGVQLQF
jgi:hypothetical protein